MLFILIVVLVIFGPKRLPELGRSLGKGIKEFKKATTDLQGQLTDEDSKPAVEKTEAVESAKEPMKAPEAKVAPEPKMASEAKPETEAS